MDGSISLRRRIGVAACAVLGTAAAVALPASPASAFTKPPQLYGGYGSGVETFANLAPSAQLAKAQVASGRSAANSQGLTTIADELGNTVSTADPNLAARAHGDALALNVLGQPIQLVAPAERVAPPTQPEAINTLLNLPISNLASVAAVRGRASARFNDAGNVCIVGADIARGIGEAADARLLGNGTTPTGLANPAIATQTGDSNVASSISRQLLTAQLRADGSRAGAKMGVVSEVTQHVVPVAINAGGVAALTVEVAGVYQLRAFAGGLPGTAFIQYNPETNAQAPVVRLTFPVGGAVDNLLTPILTPLAPALLNLVQPTPGQLLVPLGPALQLVQPLVDVLASAGIVIGEGPRAIGGGPGGPLQAADGTHAAGAIDLVRIRPAGPLAALAALIGDVRVGHMEVDAFAPSGGIDCPGLGVAKVADRDPVQVGETFTYTITVTNPYDCTLTNVRVQDDITANNGITFTVGTTDPAGGTATPITDGQRVLFADVGPIGPRGTKPVNIPVTINSASGNGVVSDTATVTADCATGLGTGQTDVNLNLVGSVTLHAPRVGGVAVLGLARTGRDDGSYLLLGLTLLLALAGVEAIRRRSHDRA